MYAADKVKGVCYFNCLAELLVSMNELNTHVQESVLSLNKSLIEKLDPSKEEDLNEIFILLEVERTARINQVLPNLSCNKKRELNVLSGNYELPTDFFEHKVKPLNTGSDKNVFLSGDNFKNKCSFNKIISAAITKDGDITNALRETNFDPCCLPSMTRNQIAGQDNTINGFSVGVEAGGGAGPLGYDVGYEFVMVQTGPETLEVGVFKYKGPETSISIPAGTSVTQSVLIGDCKKLDDYLGYFSSVGVAGMQLNVGMSANPLNKDKEPTGCDSESITVGTSSDLIGTSQTYYSKASDFVKVKGPQIKKLLELFEKSNKDSKRRQFHTISPNGLKKSIKNSLHPSFRRMVSGSSELPSEEKVYNPKDFEVPGCELNVEDQLNDDFLTIGN